MFEKEAEEYLKKDGTKAEQILDSLNEISPLKITLKQFPFILAILEQTFKDGAEYGYNKALDEATHNYNAIIADYDKRIAELEKEKTDLVQEKNNLEYKIENLENKVEHHQEVIDTLQKKLERNCTSKGERINEN